MAGAADVCATPAETTPARTLPRPSLPFSSSSGARAISAGSTAATETTATARTIRERSMVPPSGLGRTGEQEVLSHDVVGVVLGGQRLRFRAEGDQASGVG